MEEKKGPLSAFLPGEMAEILELKQKYRGKQIFEWIHKGVFQFDGMSNLSKELRDELNANWTILSSQLDQEFNDNDGTVKFRFRLADGHMIESVLLTDIKDRRTACLSSQVGCRMGCRFCRTGQMQFKRNLTRAEIVEQFLIMKSLYGDISHIVFMGMGEPLDNLMNVRKAVELLNHPDGTNIGMRKITLSTCGLIQGLEEFTLFGPDVKLAVSLISADQKLREQLMPVAKLNPLPKLKQTLRKYQERHKKRLTLEVVLLKGINDNQKEIYALAEFLKDLQAVVNVIPWNPAEGLPYEKPDGKSIAWFKEELEDMDIEVTQRFRRGTGINAACGQLCPEESE